MDPIFFINVIVLIVLINCLKTHLKASAQKKREQERLALRQAASKSGKRQPKIEELPELAPVAASAAPEVENPVTAVPVVEPAPAPVVDPTLGWSKPVFDETVLSIPAYIRRAGITPYAAYRRLNPLKVPVVLLSARKPELDSEPVFDFGERLPVGFDGAPVL